MNADVRGREPGLPANDAGGFRDILPPGTRGHYNAIELAAFLATGQTVPHCCDQLPMYRDLVYATPGLAAEQIPSYFKDSSFSVPPGEAERTYSPREYCGRGSLRRCRRALRRSLQAALAVPASELYGGDEVCPTADQWCFDAIRFSPVGGARQPLIHWVNRPTYQQANEIRRRLPR